jgi:hypothetical protein
LSMAQRAAQYLRAGVLQGATTETGRTRPGARVTDVSAATCVLCLSSCLTCPVPTPKEPSSLLMRPNYGGANTAGGVSLVSDFLSEAASTYVGSGPNPYAMVGGAGWVRRLAGWDQGTCKLHGCLSH